MSKITLISILHNGLPLLPYWLKHHYPMVDEGILLDYGSTDESIEIVHELAPHWKIVSVTDEYSCLEADQEIKKIENSVDGWKISPNVTEFIVCPDLREVLANINTPCVIPKRAAIMIDSPATKDQSLTDDSLVIQKHHGIYNMEFPTNIGFPADYRQHQRVIHKLNNAPWSLGRHYLIVPPTHITVSDDFVIDWFAWSPYNLIRKRKQEVKFLLSQKDLDENRGYQHYIAMGEQDKIFNGLSTITKDLMWDPYYRNLVNGH